MVNTPETSKPSDPIFSRVQNVIIGDNALAVQAAIRQAREEGFYAESLGGDWQGEAREVGEQLARKLRVAAREVSRPFCLVAGGETTVSLSGAAPFQRNEEIEESRDISNVGRRNQRGTDLGKGGRNQELALAAVPHLAGLENVMLISLATDGEDGPTSAAGAVVNGETLARAEQLGLAVADHLSRHDAHPFFERLGDLIRSGPTDTNVNDLVFLLSLEENPSF